MKIIFAIILLVLVSCGENQFTTGKLASSLSVPSSSVTSSSPRPSPSASPAPTDKPKYVKCENHVESNGYPLGCEGDCLDKVCDEKSNMTYTCQPTTGTLNGRVVIVCECLALKK